MIARISVISSFIFLIAGLIFWIAWTFDRESNLLFYRNISFLGFYLIHLFILASRSRFLKLPLFRILAAIGVITVSVGGYMMSEFHPWAETVLVCGLSILVFAYTLWIVIKRPKLITDILKWIWVAGMSFRVGESVLDLNIYEGPLLDIFWFGAFILLSVIQSRDILKAKTN